MTPTEFYAELDDIIDTVAAVTGGDTEEYVDELAEHDEELAEAMEKAFSYLEQAAERALELKEDGL